MVFRTGGIRNKVFVKSVFLCYAYEKPCGGTAPVIGFKKSRQEIVMQTEMLKEQIAAARG